MSKLPKGFLRDPRHFLAFGFGSGCAPKAPGTFGTVAGMLVFALVLQPLPLALQALMILLGFIAGIALCQRAAESLGVHDHGGIVWDEFVGYWITMFAAPTQWYWLVVGFVLFRLFDIWKPAPIKQLDQSVAGGLGIMLDDVVAGVYAAVCLQLLVWGVASI